MEQDTVQESGGTQPWTRAALFLLTLAVLIVCGLILHPFFSAIVGAVVLAIATQRPYAWLTRRVGNGNLSATLALVAVILSVVVPGFFLAQSLGTQVLAIIVTLRQDSTQAKMADFLGRHQSVVSRVQDISDSFDLSHAVQTVTAFVGTKLAGFLGNSIGAITDLVVMLFLLFFLYRDRDQAVRFARSLLPLDDEEASEMLTRVADTIYATALGRLVIAGIQGTLSGLAFWVLGVQGAILWAVLTVVMAMIPAFGAVLVWAPIAIYLGLTGHWGKAALLAVWGGAIVSTIDNILYPILVGSRLRNHTASILLSILGGVALFGLTGIILGPVMFTIAGTLLEFWRRRSDRTQETAIH